MIRMIRNQSFWMGAMGCLFCFGLLQLVSNLPWAKAQALPAESGTKGVTPSSGGVTSGKAPGSGSAARLIPFQAYLTDSNGRPVEGQHGLTFRIYDDPTQGAPLWSETHGNVPVSKGMVNVLLGSMTSFGSVTFDAGRYVGVSVDGALEMVPRQQVIPAIYAADSDRAKEAEYAVNADDAVRAQNAVNAQNAVSAQNATHAADALKLVTPGTMDPAVIVAPNGKVGIGVTEPPVVKLDIQGGSVRIHKNGGRIPLDGQWHDLVTNSEEHVTGLYIVYIRRAADNASATTYLVLASSHYYGTSAQMVLELPALPNSVTAIFRGEGQESGTSRLQIMATNADIDVFYSKISPQ